METNPPERKKQRRRSTQERREIVEESLRPGNSVAIVARAHGVNANQVFAWRKLYREGRLEVEGDTNPLLPVKVSEPLAKPRRRRFPRTLLPVAGVIDIDLGHARLRIQGVADPACVRAAVEALRR